MFGGDGLSMMLRNMIGEENLKNIFETFDKIKQGVVDMGNAVTAIQTQQKAADELAAARHAEILALFKALGVEPVAPGAPALPDHTAHKPN